MATTDPDEAPQLVPSAPTPEQQQADLLSMAARATALYSKKAYTEAADLYADAATLQSSLNGELAVENADLLYSYGRCLYKVALANSDVLGGKVPDGNAAGAEGEQVQSKKRKGDDVEGHSSKKAKVEEDEEKADARFDFGTEDVDDEWEDEEDEDEDVDAAQGEQEEEQDDFATAYEVLDVARVLLSKKLAALQSAETMEGDAKGKGKGKAAEAVLTPETRRIKETLADTHDIQAEILLENEQFVNAVADSRAALSLKQELYPQGSGLVAEAHYKLSLALEFASVTPEASNGAEEGGAGAAESSGQEKKAGEGGKEEGAVDLEMRREAAEQMSLAIKSTRMRLASEREKLAAMVPDSEEAVELAKSVKDVEEMVGEMELKHTDLLAPASSLTGPTASLGASDPALAALGDDIKGMIGSLLGGGAAQPAAQAHLQSITKGANDLTGMARKKRKD